MKASRLLFQKIDLNKVFDEWLDQVSVDEYLRTHFSYDEMEFLEEVKSEFAAERDLSQGQVRINSSEFKDFFKDAKNLKIRELARDWFDDRIFDLQGEMDSKLEVTKDGFTVYRAMTISNVDEFLFHLANGTTLDSYKGIGVSWSWNKDAADSYWGRQEGESVEVVLKGFVPLASINQKFSLILNLHPSMGEEEAELRMIEGQTVFISEIIIEGESSIVFPTPVAVQA